MSDVDNTATAMADLQDPSEVYNFVVHRAHAWRYNLSAPDETSGKSFLTVETANYDSDSGSGQNLVVSAFFRVCEILEVGGVGVMSHSGGWVRCEVLPESEEQE